MNHADRSIPVIVRGIPNFWQRVRAAPYRLLGLDYDGTLPPFRKARMEARPLPDVLSTLQAIQNSRTTSLFVISGRPVSEIAQLLGNLPIHIIGAHGYEERELDGKFHASAPTQRQQHGLETANARAIEQGYESFVELKAGSIALHSRGVVHPPESYEEVKTAWQHVGQQHDLLLKEFAGGIELRAYDRNKGTAFRERLEKMPSGTLPVYVGDDETDEDAFQVVRSTGIGIKVGGKKSKTMATGFLEDCNEVVRFLSFWQTMVGS